MKNKNIYVIAWNEIVLPGMKDSLNPGEELVMYVCPDCLKDDDEIIPDKELWRYVIKGRKYKCVCCEKEIIG